MTIRDAYQNLLIELNKVQAPSLLLDDFIYMFNKGVQQYVNKRYNLFETKQQLTDDLRVLTKTVKIIPTLDKSGAVFGQSYKCELPDDYLHILNCICEFPDFNDKCNRGGKIQQGANKLDTTQWAHIINNYYMRPSMKRPYYYIINIEEPSKDPTFTDGNRKKITVNGQEQRYGNSTKPIMQIKCGDAKLDAVYVDYLRAPQYLSIQQEQLDDMVDNTQVIEFPDYVIYEIINEIVNIVMENGSNPRVQTHAAVSQSIA